MLWDCSAIETSPCHLRHGRDPLRHRAGALAPQLAGTSPSPADSGLAPSLESLRGLRDPSCDPCSATGSLLGRDPAASSLP